MREFAAFIVRNRLAAGLAASLGGALPLLGIVGGAAAGLVTLHQGLPAGLLVAGMGSALASGLTWLVGGQPALGVILVLVSTLPVCGLAWVLRRSVSLSMAAQAGVLGAAALVALFFAAVGDPAAFWREVAQAWLSGGGGEALGAAEREELLNQLPFTLLTGSFAANGLLLSLGSLFLARSAQARLMNPGGFRREFYGLRLGRILLAVTVLLLAGAVFSGWSLAVNLLAVFFAGWLVQGFAVIHQLVAAYGLPTGWLVVSYVATAAAALFAGPLVMAFPLLGIADEVIDIRGRVTRARGDRSGRGKND